MSQNIRQPDIAEPHFQTHGNQLAEIIIPRPPQRCNFDEFAHRTSVVMGSIQIGIGVLCLVLSLMSICSEVVRAAMMGYETWCGVIFIVTGGLCVGAGKETNLIISVLVMCLISASMPVPVIITSASINLARQAEMYYRQEQYDDGESDSYMNNSDSNEVQAQTGVMSVSSIMLTLVLFEFVVAVISAVACCSWVCCCKSHPTTVPNGKPTGQSAQVAMDYIPTPSGNKHVNSMPPMYTQTGNLHVPQAMAAYGQPPVYSESQPQHDIGDSDKQLLI